MDQRHIQSTGWNEEPSLEWTCAAFFGKKKKKMRKSVESYLDHKGTERHDKKFENQSLDTVKLQICKL